MKKLVNLRNACAVALSVVLFGSCMKNDNIPQEPQPYASIVFFNAYPYSTGVTLSLDGQTIQQYNNRNSLIYGDYIGLPTTKFGDQKLVYLATNNTILNESTIKLEENGTYSSFLYGNEEAKKTILLRDSASTSTDSRPKIRFVNLGENVGNVDLFLAGERVNELSNRATETQQSTSLAQRFISSPREASGAQIVIKDSEGEEIVKTQDPYNFASNRYYTIVLHGDKLSTGDSTEAKAKAPKITVYFY